MAIFRLETTQILHSNIHEVWEFIASPKNLKYITPEYMGFDIKTPDLPEKMYPGMMIEYVVKPFWGIGMRWLTEITHVRDLEFFVDEQRSGPYTLWHHEHHIKKVEMGVLMTDIVHYIPPFGVLGNLANRILIRKQLKEIFDFRTRALDARFDRLKHQWKE